MTLLSQEKRINFKVKYKQKASTLEALIVTFTFTNS
ncbi:hypothetical protein PNC201_08880 [Pseudoalteromonas sp. NC201]|nr:hypothetical protein PNC201_08880 [Pseudoalteromonas sp. NC201]